MKRLLLILALTILGMSITSVQAIDFKSAINDKKPCAVLIYADWAENLNDILMSFGSIEQQYAGKYNFVRINISKEEAKDFNKTNYIYPNLPYILLYKERGRMSRCITQDCITNGTCMKDKMDLFAN